MKTLRFVGLMALATLSTWAAAGPYALLPNGSSNQINVADLSNGSLLAPVTVGKNPIGVSVAPNALSALVSNSGDGSISQINLSTWQASLWLSLGPNSRPQALRHVANLNQVWLADAGDNTLKVIDASQAGPKVLSTINLGAAPLDMAISANGARAYLSLPAANSVAVVDVAQQKVLATLTVGKNPRALALTPNNQYLLVANYDDQTLSVIDTASLQSYTIQDKLPLKLAHKHPVSLKVSADGEFALIASADERSIDWYRLPFDNYSQTAAETWSLYRTSSANEGIVSLNINPSNINLVTLQSNGSLNFGGWEDGTLGNGTAASNGSGFNALGDWIANSGTQLGWSQITYNRNEGVGNASLTVWRSGDITGTSTVKYETKGDSAVAGQDYFDVSGTLTFAPYEQVKTVKVPIVDDLLYGPDEKFTVTLSNPSNATLSSMVTSSVVIQNNDADPRSNKSGGCSMGDGRSGEWLLLALPALAWLWRQSRPGRSMTPSANHGL